MLFLLSCFLLSLFSAASESIVLRIFVACESPSSLHFALFIVAHYYVCECVIIWKCVFIHKEEV